MAWSLVEWLHKGRVTLVGTCTGAIAGLAAASAACASVPPFSAILIGLLVPPLGYAAVVRRRMTVDDALDVSSIHGVCGALGVLAPILLARSVLTAQSGRPVGGLLEGESSLVLPQLVALAAVLLYSLVATLVILKAVDLALGLRVSADDEDAGLDLSQHGGRGYILEAGEAFILRSRNALDVDAAESDAPPSRWGHRG
jgi:Amt family ammonium transporter